MTSDSIHSFWKIFSGGPTPRVFDDWRLIFKGLFKMIARFQNQVRRFQVWGSDSAGLCISRVALEAGNGWEQKL
jgi:hypothetical protein